MSKSDVDQFEEFSDSVKRGLADGIKEDRAGYAELLEKVRAVNPEAAAFMNFQAPAMAGFMFHRKLMHAFPWSLTPQGNDYWLDVMMSLGELDE